MVQKQKDISAHHVISINDLRDMYYDGIRLSQEAYLALKNFDLHRIAYLNAALNDEDFKKRYFELQVKANLSPFAEFIKIQ